MSPGRALRAVARNACVSSSPVGSRTRSHRIGTGGTPPRYHSAVPVEISTRRLGSAIPQADAVTLPDDLAILNDGGQLFQGLTFDRPAAAAFALLRREVEQVGIETQAGDDTDMVADRGKKFDGCKRTVGDQNDIAIGEPA